MALRSSWLVKSETLKHDFCSANLCCVGPGPSYSSHEQRLSASLDEALLCALQGRPSFTSSLSQQGAANPASETPDTSQTAESPNTQTGGI